MIKIVYSEVDSPLTVETSLALGNSRAVRAVNLSKTPQTVSLLTEEGPTHTVTLTGGESLILKKTSLARVYSSSNTVRITGVSIY
jgi:hypothetical protein